MHQLRYGKVVHHYVTYLGNNNNKKLPIACYGRRGWVSVTALVQTKAYRRHGSVIVEL